MNKIALILFVCSALTGYGQDSQGISTESIRYKQKFIEMVVRDSARAQQYLDQGKENFSKGNFKDAMFDLDESILAGGGDSAYYYRGRTEIALYKREEALVDFDTLLTRHPDNSRYYYYRGYVWKQLENFDSAMADFDRAIRLDPGYVDAWLEHGDIYEWRGNYKAAMADCNKAISLDPKQYYSYYSRADLYHATRDFDLAILDCDTAIMLNRSYSSAWWFRGLLRVKAGDTAASCADFNKAFELGKTENSIVWGDAAGSLRKYCQSDPYTDPDILHAKPPPVPPSYEEEQPPANSAKENHKRALQAAENFLFTVAITDETNAIRLDPNYKEAYLDRGELRYRMNKLKDAVADFDKVVFIDPQDTPAYFYRGTIRNLLWDFAGALSDFDKVIQINPQYPLAYTGRGEAKFNLGQYEPAIADFNKAISLDSFDSRALMLRGRARMTLSQPLSACEDFRLADEKGNQPAAQMYYKYCRRSERGLGPPVIVRAPNAPSAAYDHLHKGIRYYNHNDFADAVTELTKYMQTDTSFDGYYYRGLSQVNLGTWTAAIDDLTRALAIDSSKGDAYYMRGKAKLGIRMDAGACMDFRRAGQMGLHAAKESINLFCQPDTVHSYPIASEKEAAYIDKMDSTMAEIYLQKAFEEARAFDFKAAIAYQTRAIDNNPNYKEAYFNRGLAHVNTKDLDAGLEDFNKAIEIDPQYGDAYFGRASVKMKQEKFKEALSDYDKAISLNSADGKSYMLRGMCLLGLDQMDEGCADLHRADELGYFQAPQMIAKYCSTVGEHSKPIKSADKSAVSTQSSKLLPTSSEASEIPADSLSSPQAWFSHGMSRFDAQDYVAAIPFFNKALTLDPKYVDAHFALGNIALISNQYHRCIGEMNTAISVDSNDGKCYLLRGAGRLAMVEDERGDHNLSDEEKKALTDSACRDLHRAEDLGDYRATEYIKRYCLDAEGHFQLGLKLIKEKYEKQAIAEFDKAIAVDDHFAKAYAYRAYCEMHYSRSESAREDLIVAMALDPKYARAYYFRAMLKTEDDRGFKEALPDLDKAIQLDSTDAEIYFYRAYFKDELKDYQGAEADLSRTIQLDPADAKAYKFRGEERDRLKDYSGAVSDYDHVVALDPGSYEIYKLRGRIKYSHGDYQGAIADFDQSMKVSPYDLSPMVDRGMAKAALKDYTGAIADYTGDLSHGDYYEAYYQRAKVYITLGKIADACADLKKAGGSSHKDVDELIAKYCK